MNVKKLFALIMAVALVLVSVFPVGALANDNTAGNQGSETTNGMRITMQIGNPVMTVNGQNVNIDNLGTTPVIRDSRTLLPVRAFVENIGGNVEWNAADREVTLSYNSAEIRLTIDSSTAYLNNVTHTLDTTPVIINGRTMLPIRFIAESFGFNVEWDGSTSTVTIEKASAGKTDVDGGKTLVVYYSAQGHTVNFAEAIAEELNADIFEITPVDEYTSADLNWNDENSRVTREHEDESLRDIPLTTTQVENWDSYDTVYIGYPIWWGIAAWPVDNFVKNNDFTGKTVIPFATSSSSGMGQSATILERYAGSGNWLEGQRFQSNESVANAKGWAAAHRQ